MIFNKNKPSNAVPVRIYSPASVMGNKRLLFHEMWTDIAASWELAVALARRELSAKYRQSILGYLWAFLPVLGTTGVFLFLRSGGALAEWDHAIAYPVYLLIGTILWQVFVDAVQGPLNVITSSRAMLVKINFPRESLIIAAMLVTWFNFFVRLIILVPALILFALRGQYSYDWSVIYAFPVGVIALVILGYTIGLLLTPMGMLYKDVQMGVTMVLGFWMFLSPVVVDIPNGGALSTVMKWNPVTPVLDSARAWLVGSEAILLIEFWLVAAVTLIFLVFGWVIYRVALPHIIARLGM